jgi:hypothetical protein
MNQINLREEFNELLQDYGYEFLIQRQSNIFNCNCSQKKEEKIFRNNQYKCNICNDSGKIIKLEKRKGIKQSVSQETLINTGIGKISTPTYKFYFDYASPIQKGDIIYEVGWVKNIPRTLHNRYEITYHEFVRGNKGRIEYIIILAEERNINLISLQKEFINNIFAYKNNFLKKGV